MTVKIRLMLVFARRQTIVDMLYYEHILLTF